MTLARASFYLEPEFNLGPKLGLEGFVVAVSLVRAIITTTLAGPGTNWF
mgnify:CR=1 FL=1